MYELRCFSHGLVMTIDVCTPGDGGGPLNGCPAPNGSAPCCASEVAAKGEIVVELFPEHAVNSEVENAKPTIKRMTVAVRMASLSSNPWCPIARTTVSEAG